MISANIGRESQGETGIEGTIDIDSSTGFAEEEYSFPSEIEQEPPRRSRLRQANAHSPKARRAIEDMIERKRLDKEIDYLFDDEFGE